MRAFLFLSLLIAATFASVLLHAGDGKSHYYNVTSDGPSPNRDVQVEHYRSDGFGISPVAEQIWLVSTEDPSVRRLLYTHQRDATVLFSDDEKWLVINDHNLSNESRLLLFQRDGLVDYHQVADLTDAAWEFFASQANHGKPHTFDHSYAEALRWAETAPPTLLLSLRGHLDSRNYTEEWYCFYNIEAKSFSTDLNDHNKRVTNLAGN